MMIRFYKIFLVIFCVSCGSSGEDNISTTKAIGSCVDMRMETQCINQTVCRIVCGAAGAAAGVTVGNSPGAAAGVGAATVICDRICEEVPKCSQIAVCYRWSNEPY